MISKESKMEWLLASILYNKELRPDHIGAIKEVLDYPTQRELVVILEGRNIVNG